MEEGEEACTDTHQPAAANPQQTRPTPGLARAAAVQRVQVQVWGADAQVQHGANTRSAIERGRPERALEWGPARARLPGRLLALS